MKPKIFIGSSVEGLTAAYSIQQNLTHDAEITVWDQGVFELSKTTIESLMNVLEQSDFGIFIFSPDDISKIRNKENSVIRDNVLFEFGLFVGKLSRERVFFIIPTGSDFHLPTDLLGVTPGVYDSNREDKSLQAAMGPVSHQIRLQIKKIGLVNPLEEISEEPLYDTEKDSTSESNEDFWLEIFIEKNYLRAIELLEKEKKTEKDKIKLLEKEVWLAYCKLNTNEIEGYTLIDKLLKENSENSGLHNSVSLILAWYKDYDKAYEILNDAISRFEDNSKIVVKLAELYKENHDEELAEELLLKYSNTNKIDIMLEYFDLLESQKRLIEARDIIHRAYILKPKDEKIRFLYAKLAIDINENEVAIFLLDSLVKEFPSNISYLGYLSNCSINLMLYDIGMTMCKKANELAEEKQDWLILNIGNMLKNKGFYTESNIYFERGLELNKNSDYGHDRLSASLKYIQEEKDKAKKMISDGKKKLKEYLINLSDKASS
jgi:tetratricopeptide (TPR) repeat protein